MRKYPEKYQNNRSFCYIIGMKNNCNGDRKPINIDISGWIIRLCIRISEFIYEILYGHEYTRRSVKSKKFDSYRSVIDLIITDYYRDRKICSKLPIMRKVHKRIFGLTLHPL